MVSRVPGASTASSRPLAEPTQAPSMNIFSLRMDAAAVAVLVDAMSLPLDTKGAQFEYCRAHV